ncbi:helix-turn-helix transcriptional regulator [Agrobacterium rubi]|nr:helix-turn-helix transcriptional regulator [Agrobacterium rubi]NTF24728.1 helix-turn-helix transcriptional regulator [Agrobacterium rubi]
MANWLSRLKEAVNASGRSQRDICLSARKSPGYLHDILNGNKIPTLGSVTAVCNEIGVSPAIVLTGMDMQRDSELIQLLEADPEMRQNLLLVLRGYNPPALGDHISSASET